MGKAPDGSVLGYVAGASGDPALVQEAVALATDAYSEVIDEFDSGVPVVALHGTNTPEYVGQARSNGCIRVPNEIIQQLADTMPQGTPVYIFP